MDSTDAYTQRSNSQKVSRAARGLGVRGKRVVLRAVAAPLAALLLLFSLQPMPNAESPKPQEEQPVYGLTEETPERETPESKSNADYWYELYSDHVELVCYLGYAERVSIPRQLDGRPVTVIKNNCFNRRSYLKDVTIPDSVTSIAEGAFRSCTALTAVDIPDSVTTIGKQAFAFCSGLERVDIPDSVTCIGSEAFEYCKALRSVVIPDSVTRIESYTFSNCEALSEVTIPERVVSVGDCTFQDTAWLESLRDEFVMVGDGILLKYNGKGGSVVIPQGVKFIAATFEGCKLTDVTIPDSVTGIGGGAFDGSALEQVSIPDSVVRIDDGAFQNSALRSVNIPDSVTLIGERAFMYCRGLESVTIPDSVTDIGDYAFKDCEKLKNVAIPSGTSLSTYAFYGVSGISRPDGFRIVDDGRLTGYSGDEKNVVIPDGAKYIAYHAFPASVESIVIPDSVISIGHFALSRYDKLTSVSISDSVTSIGSRAFEYCTSLKELSIPGSVKVIGSGAFSKCTSLRSLSILPGVTDIGYEAFADCTSLTKLSLSDGLTRIGDRAFVGCTSLTDISIPGSVTDVAASAFEGTPWLGKQDDEFVIVGDRVLISYNGAGGDVVIPDGVRHISGAFSGCETLTSVRIPDTVTSIGDGAFIGCAELEKLSIPGSVSCIGRNAFAGTPWYESLTDEFVIVGDGVLLKYNGTDRQVRIPSGVKYITDAFMSGNTSTDVTEVTLPDSVRVIGDKAFAYQHDIKSIVIPDSVISIGKEAFVGCSLQQLLLPDSVTDIGELAFCGNLGLRFVSVPNSVRVIGDQAFSECNALSNAVIAESVMYIGGGTFASCFDLFISCPPGSYARLYGKPDLLAQ